MKDKLRYEKESTKKARKDTKITDFRDLQQEMNSRIHEQELPSKFKKANIHNFEKNKTELQEEKRYISLPITGSKQNKLNINLKNIYDKDQTTISEESSRKTDRLSLITYEEEDEGYTMKSSTSMYNQQVKKT